MTKMITMDRCTLCWEQDGSCESCKAAARNKLKPLQKIHVSFSSLDNPLLKLLQNMDKDKTERMKTLVEAVRLRTEKAIELHKRLDKLLIANNRDIAELESYWTEKYQSKK